MRTSRFRCPSFALAVFLMFGSGHHGEAQPLGVNPSAAPSDIANPSSINPAARASDIRNPSAINPAGAASQIPGSSAVTTGSPGQMMPRVARARAVERTRQSRATAKQVEQRRERAVPNRASRGGQGTTHPPFESKPKLSASDTEGAKARAANEAQEKTWDASTKKWMSGICVGC